MRFRGHKGSLFSCGLVAAGVLATAPALAEVKREGTWPAADPKVSLDVTRAPREEAIRKLADAAGWSVVVHAPSTDPVDVHVKDQPASKVLDLLLLDADYVATRDGTLVSIRRAKVEAPSAPKPGAMIPAPGKPSDPEDPSDVDPPDPPDPPEPADVPDPPDPPEPGELPNVAMPPMPPIPPMPAMPPVPPVPPLPPMAGTASASAHPSASASAAVKDMPKERGRDVAITGDDLKVSKKQVVRNVSVVGGDIDVYGIVTGSIRAVGGDVHIHPGARIFGGVSSMGGDVRVEDLGRIDGAVNVAGGVLRRSEKAILGGDVKGEVRTFSSGKGDHDDDDDDDDEMMAAGKSGRRLVESKAAEVGSSFARMALLFVFGTVLLALQTERMDDLKAELVARPMRSFAMGVLGAIGSAAMFLVLCVTVIGIPFALLGALGLFLALAASVCAVLETIGRALVRHRSQNPYLHLGLGCGLFLGATALPWIGPIIGTIVVLLALGVLVSTRGAGLLHKTLRGAQPYRSATV